MVHRNKGSVSFGSCVVLSFSCVSHARPLLHYTPQSNSIMSNVTIVTDLSKTLALSIYNCRIYIYCFGRIHKLYYTVIAFFVYLCCNFGFCFVFFLGWLFLSFYFVRAVKCSTHIDRFPVVYLFHRRSSVLLVFVFDVHCIEPSVYYLPFI